MSASDPSQKTGTVSLDTIRAAAARIAPFVAMTPLVRMTPSGVSLFGCEASRFAVNAARTPVV